MGVAAGSAAASHHSEQAERKRSASARAGVTDALSVADVRSRSISLFRGLKLGRKGAGPSACNVVDHNPGLDFACDCEALRNTQPHPLTIPRRRVIDGSQ